MTIIEKIVIINLIIYRENNINFIYINKYIIVKKWLKYFSSLC